MYPTRRIAGLALLVVLCAAGVAIVGEFPLDFGRENPRAIQSEPTTGSNIPATEANRIPPTVTLQSAATGQPESAAARVQVSSDASAQAPTTPVRATSQKLSSPSAATPGPEPRPEAPAEWQITGSNVEGYTLLTDRSSPLSGTACALLTSKHDTDTSRFGALMQYASAEPFAGKRVEFSGYIATTAAPASAALWLRADAADGATVGFENTMARGIRGTEDWSYQYIVMDVPRDASVLVYGALLNGRGKLSVDDLQFRIVDEKTPVTAKPIERRPGSGRGLASQPPQEPRNLDFEETR